MTETLTSAAPGNGLASRSRPAPAGPLSASLAFAWRSLLKIKHVPEQLGDVTGIPVCSR